MDDKKSLILYYDYLENFDMLDDRQLREVIYAMIEYDKNDNLNELDKVSQMAFSFIKKNLDRDKEKWLKIKQKNAENGAKGGRPKKTQNNPKNPTVISETQPNPKKPLIVTDTVNENDNVTVNDIPKGIIDYLNIKANKNYKYTKSNISLINSRLKENYKVEDFKTVIDKKYNEWKNTDYEKFLQPSTLFGNKFDNYLNQNVKVNVNQIAFTDEEMESLGLERLDFNE